MWITSKCHQGHKNDFLVQSKHSERNRDFSQFWANAYPVLVKMKMDSKKCIIVRKFTWILKCVAAGIEKPENTKPCEWNMAILIIPHTQPAAGR